MLLSILSITLLNLIVITFSILFKKLILDYDIKKYNNTDFVFGFFFLIFISILLNFFFPLYKVSIFIISIGFFFFIYFYFIKKIKIELFNTVIVVFFLVFISHNQGIGYDSQLYHLQIIKFNSYFKSIFGIANLEQRFAMNSSWHPLISLFNIEYKRFNIIYIFNLSFYSFFIGLVFSIEQKLKNSYFFLLFSIIFIIIYSIFHPFHNGTILNNLGSPEVDIVSAIFFIYCIYLFLIILESHDDRILKYTLIISCILTLTIKISYIAVIFFYFWILLKDKRIIFSKINIFAILLLVIWTTKSFISSGCLLFPLQQTCIKTIWSLNAAEVENYKNIVQSFSRDTPDRLRFGDFHYTLRTLNWLQPWVKEYFLKTEFLYISFSLTLFGSLYLIYKFLFSRKNFFFNKNYLFIIFVLIISLLIWFNAPEIRFGYGTIISLTSIIGLLVVRNFFKNLDFLTHKKILTFLFFLFFLLIIKNYKNYKVFDEFFIRNFDYNNFILFYEKDDVKIYNPPPGEFCSYFINFCSYKKNNVLIKKYNNYLLFLN